MRRIYAIVLGTSLLTAALCFGPMDVLARSPDGIGLEAVVAAVITPFLAVWLGFLVCFVAIRRASNPSVFMAAGTGIVVGGLSGLLTAVALGEFSIDTLGRPLTFLIFLTGAPLFIIPGAIIGLPLGVMNYLIWSRLGVISQLVVRQIQGK